MKEKKLRNTVCNNGTDRKAMFTGTNAKVRGPPRFPVLGKLGHVTMFGCVHQEEPVLVGFFFGIGIRNHLWGRSPFQRTLVGINKEFEMRQSTQQAPWGLARTHTTK